MASAEEPAAAVQQAVASAEQLVEALERPSGRLQLAKVA